jgi:hypothetical protein
MNTILIRLLASLSRATLDPAFGGRGMALSRVLSLAAFGIAKDDPDALQEVGVIVERIEASLRTPRHLTHEEWNELQAAAESGHWFLRAQFPQVSATGTVAGGYTPNGFDHAPPQSGELP